MENYWKGIYYIKNTKKMQEKSALRIPLDQKKNNSENLTVDKSSISSHGSNGSHLHQSHQAHDEGVKLGAFRWNNIINRAQKLFLKIGRFPSLLKATISHEFLPIYDDNR